jgi:hypothetical protein
MSAPTTNTQTPFLDVKSFLAEETLSPEQYIASPNLASSRSSSPFVSIYEMEEEGGPVDPRAEDYVAFLSELYDEEFDEAIFELVNEAAALYEERSARSFGEVPTRDPTAERFLEAHFEPLTREIERMLEALMERFGQADGNTLNESELESFFDQYRPGVELSPSFENFLGKIGKAFKKAASVVGNLALGPIFNKLKALIRPFLKGVLEQGISRLSPELQPIAKKLAERLGLLKELEGETQDSEGMLTADVSHIQHKFNRQIADLLFATSEVQQDLEVSRRHGLADANGQPVGRVGSCSRSIYKRAQPPKRGRGPRPPTREFYPGALAGLEGGAKACGSWEGGRLSG